MVGTVGASPVLADGGGRYLYRSLLSYIDYDQDEPSPLSQWLDEPQYSDDEIHALLVEVGEYTVLKAYRMDIPWEYHIPLGQVVTYLNTRGRPYHQQT